MLRHCHSKREIPKCVRQASKPPGMRGCGAGKCCMGITAVVTVYAVKGGKGCVETKEGNKHL